MKSSAILFFVVANLLFLTTNIPLIYRILRAPATHTFTLNNMDIGSDNRFDYNQYLSAITQGMHGYWLYQDAFTSEPTQPGIFFSYYIVLGKISGVLHLWPPVAYHLARIISVELFFTALYLCIRLVTTGRSSVFALFFTLFASTAPSWFFGEPGVFTEYTPWWTLMNALNRVDLPPHHIFAQSLFLYTIYFLISYVRMPKPSHLFAAGVFCLLAGFILTPASLLLCASLIAATLLSVRHIRKHMLVLLIVIISTAVVGVVAAKYQMRSGFPWDMWSSWEVAMWNTNPRILRSFAFVLGVLPLLALPTLWSSLRSGTWEDRFLAFWAVMPFLLLPFATLMGIGNVRLMSVAPVVPLSVWAGRTVTLYVPNKRKASLLVGAVFLLTVLPGIMQLFHHKYSHVQKEYLYFSGSTNNHISATLRDTLDFMEKNLPAGSVVLTSATIGNLIPAFTPQITYIGHTVLTREYGQKEAQVRQFYTNGMSTDQARTFLHTNTISYILFGTEEKMSETLSYPFLQSVYSNADTTLYTIQ